MPQAARCRRTSSRSTTCRLQGGCAQARRLANRQAQACRGLEHRSPGHPQLDGGPPQASAQLRRRDHPEGPVSARSEPDLLPARSTSTAAPLCRSTKDDIQALRRHLEPGGGTLFADAACGSAAFDASFRRFVAKLLPDHPLVPIPRDDELYSAKVGFDLSDVQYTEAAGGRRGFPQLEGVKINDHWAIIYSKYDIGCALERHTGARLQGLHPRERGQDRRQHRDLRNAAVSRHRANALALQS